MKGYVIRTEETKSIKKIVKKYGIIPIKTKDIDGVIEIHNYRKYPYSQEVDIVFKGKIHATIGYDTYWMGYNDIQQRSTKVSKIKLSRFLKRVTIDSVKDRMEYFGVLLRYRSDIKSVKWLS